MLLINWLYRTFSPAPQAKLDRTTKRRANAEAWSRLAGHPDNDLDPTFIGPRD